MDKRFFAIAAAVLLAAGCGGSGVTALSAPEGGKTDGPVTVEQQLLDPQKWTSYAEQEPS